MGKGVRREIQSICPHCGYKEEHSDYGEVTIDDTVAYQEITCGNWDCDQVFTEVYFYAQTEYEEG